MLNWIFSEKALAVTNNSGVAAATEWWVEDISVLLCDELVIYDQLVMCDAVGSQQLTLFRNLAGYAVSHPLVNMATC